MTAQDVEWQLDVHGCSPPAARDGESHHQGPRRVFEPDQARPPRRVRLRRPVVADGEAEHCRPWPPRYVERFAARVCLAAFVSASETT